MLDTSVDIEYDSDMNALEDISEEAKNMDISELSKLPDIESMFLNNLYKYPLLDPVEQMELCKIKDSNKEAKDRLFYHNLRMVAYIAKKYVNFGLDYMELIQEGSIGLLVAIDKFDASKGFKLSTYAICWIKNYILRAIQNTGNAIRLPINLSYKMFTVEKLRDKLKHDLEREPTIKELVDITGYSKDSVELALQYHDINLISMDKVINEGEDPNNISFGEMIEDDDFSIDEELEKKELHNILQKLLDELDDKYRIVIEMRFGINRDRQYTLEEIGKELYITRERVRQIENKALRKIRIRAKKYKALEGYGVFNDSENNL